MTYAVDDFFANGGSEALIVRLFEESGDDDDGVATTTIGGLKLRAASPGSWGDQLQARIEHPDDSSAEEAATRYGVSKDDIDRGIVNLQVGFAPLKPPSSWSLPSGRSATPDPGGRSVPQFTTHSDRHDPYKSFKFRLRLADGTSVAGVSKVSALERTREVVEHREDGDPSTSRKSPGRSRFDAITLERGVTHDADFHRWANTVWSCDSGPGAQVSLQDFRKDLILEVFNEAGQPALAYKIYRCWPSEYQAIPHLHASANEVAIATLKLENEGWERDQGVPEPRDGTIRKPGP